MTRPRRRPSLTATWVSSQSRVRDCSIATSTTVTSMPVSSTVTLRSSSSARTSVSSGRRSKRRQFSVPEPSTTAPDSMPVTRLIGTKMRRRETSTSRPSTRGGWPRSRKRHDHVANAPRPCRRWGRAPAPPRAGRRIPATEPSSWLQATAGTHLRQRAQVPSQASASAAGESRRECDLRCGPVPGARGMPP